jgi:hypothetical protein
MLKILKWSNIKISFDLNPFTWSFKYLEVKRETPVDPIRLYYLRTLMFSFLLVIDDGQIK